jgi:hypothetical protein
VGNPFAEIKSLEDIGILTRANIDQEVPFTVYNIITKTLRDIVIKPSESWGGQGLIGCEFMMGLKFNIYEDDEDTEDKEEDKEDDGRVEENVEYVEVEMNDDELKRHGVIEESKSENGNEVYGNNEICAVKEEIVGSNAKNDGQEHEGLVVNEAVMSENEVDSNKEVLKRSIAKPNKEYNPFLDTYKPINEEVTKETMGTLNTSPSDSEIIRHTESEPSKDLYFFSIIIYSPKTVI